MCRRLNRTPTTPKQTQHVDRLIPTPGMSKRGPVRHIRRTHDLSTRHVQRHPRPIDVDDTLAPTDFETPLRSLNHEPRGIIQGFGNRRILVRDRKYIRVRDLRTLQNPHKLLAMPISQGQRCTRFMPCRDSPPLNERVNVAEIPPLPAPITQRIRFRVSPRGITSGTCSVPRIAGDPFVIAERLPQESA